MKRIFFILAAFIFYGLGAQDSKVSDLTATTSPDSADIFYIIEGGTSKKILWYYMAQTGFPVDVRTNAAGNILFESFWFGEDAGINHTSAAYYNYGIGSRAHYGLTSGTANLAWGFNAGYGNTTGSGNLFQGLQSGYGLDTASFNIGQGYKNMYAGNGRGNISRGYEAAYNITGVHNIFDGWQSGYTATTADYNLGIGYRSLYSLTTGNRVTALGAYAGESVTTLTGLTYIGYNSGRYASGVGNTATGYLSLQGAAGTNTGTYNSAFGSGSMLDITSGGSNSAFGASSLANITTGSLNSGFGLNSLNIITTQGSNTAVGTYSMQDATGANSVGIGVMAGRLNESTGSIFIGNEAGDANTSGVNLVIGYQAMTTVTTGTSNTAIGYQAGDNATGSNNTIIGYDAADNLTTGSANTLVGVSSGDDLTTGNYNTFIGMESGEHVSTNGYNVGIGYNTLDGITGSHNTVIGTSAGDPEGSNALDSNIYIGFNAGSLNTTESQVLYIHNDEDNTPLIHGNFITDALTVNGSLAVTGTISGLTVITLDTDPTVVLSAGDCDNAVRFNNDADVIDYTLPGAAAGLVVMFYDIGGGVITVDAAAGDVIYLNGTALDAGDSIDSPGAVGDFIVLMAIDVTRWITMGRSGVWIDGGP